MKKVLLFAVILAAVITGFSSCKKCFVCTIANHCSRCDIAGSSGDTICEKDGSAVYQAYYAACEAQGGTWVSISNQALTQEYCEKSNDKTAIDNHRSACEYDGGVWTNK
jgi:hypothetical protein